MEGKGIPSQDVMDRATQWAEREFGGAELGDRRRTRRAVQVAAAMAAHSAGSIPDQMKTWGATKAAYRLFDEEDVTFAGLTAPHQRATREAAGQRPWVLMVQDGTDLDYSFHWGVTGLGPIGDGRGRGIMLHSVLAVAPSAGPGGGEEVLGLACQRPWYQRRVPKGETRTEAKKVQRRARQWTEAVEEIGPAPAGARWIHVADREADNFDFYDACRKQGTGFLVRSAQDRRAALGHEATAAGYVQTLARSLPAWGSRRLRVRRRPNREPGEMELQVSAARVTVFTPWLSRKKIEPLRCWVVRVWDPESLSGPEPVEWILLCSEPVETLEDALRVAEWYAVRWLIEEYHKCLKTGCAMEERQLEKAERLERAAGVLCLVAVRLLQVKQQARQSPNRPARECVPLEHLRMLAAWLGQASERMTVYAFWRGVARMGGFLGRKSDGEPGWQTLWRGWRQLDLMTLGAALGSGGDRKCG